MEVMPVKAGKPQRLENILEQHFMEVIDTALWIPFKAITVFFLFFILIYINYNIIISLHVHISYWFNGLTPPLVALWTEHPFLILTLLSEWHFFQLLMHRHSHRLHCRGNFKKEKIKTSRSCMICKSSLHILNLRPGFTWGCLPIPSVTYYSAGQGISLKCHWCYLTSLFPLFLPCFLSLFSSIS